MRANSEPLAAPQVPCRELPFTEAQCEKEFREGKDGKPWSSAESGRKEPGKLQLLPLPPPPFLYFQKLAGNSLVNT
jgi:hypothetical protein